VNVGWNVHALRSLGGDIYDGTIHGGETVDHCLHLEDLIPNVPAWWEVDSATDPVALGGQLARAIEPLLPILDRIDSGAALVRELGLDQGFYKVLGSPRKLIYRDMRNLGR
jgi:hypothetical protein